MWLFLIQISKEKKEQRGHDGQKQKCTMTSKFVQDLSQQPKTIF
jgi:hypothetical protein